METSINLILYVLVALNCFLNFTSYAQLLPQQEVQALRAITSKLQIEYWNVSANSCNSIATDFNRTIVATKLYSNVTCDCTFVNNTVCHVTNIQLKGLNLTGVFPVEFANLTHLTELDLSRNYINGSLPNFGNIPLTILGLLGNRIGGPIPKELGDISTLEEVILEDNLLEGPLPGNLGSLSRLRRLLLSANNFSGTIPESFGNLKNLTDFRIDGSILSGKIPEFIGNWTLIERLDMQGTSMEGPIPSTIELLTKLEELRFTDLKGSSVNTFPNLQNMTSLQRLSLKNCSIVGSIPEYIGNILTFKTIDLSFNELSGEIPSSFQSLAGMNHLFLGHNLLTGEIPGYLMNSKENIDLSYNYFNKSARPITCTSSELNLVASAQNSTSNDITWCAKKDIPCDRDPTHYSLFINCGGSRMDFEGNSYENDLDNNGITYFFASSDKWAYSSAGLYLNRESGLYIANNPFALNITGPEFYKSARLAPDSLKYYGLCMMKGSYKVRLHFAEIMFSNDTTFSSLGRRIFSVQIQGRTVLEDFNIMEKAGGVGIGITEEFDNIEVTGSTLEIHLYWEGKGTTAIPDRGVYGPLISGITVTPNFDVSTGGGGLSTGGIIGIVVGSLVFVFLCLFVYWKKVYLKRKTDEEKELRAQLQTGYFSLKQIKTATNNFDPENKIGEGGFGPVYKGVLPESGTVIAVKQLSAKSKQGNREFVNEIGMISALQHPHLVKLYGCCIEGNQLLLVYEYLENNSLARALFGRDDQRLNLDWATRQRICVEIAKGLAYLHEESRIKIVHRDIKATNVLLDKDLIAKISDFGLAKLDEEEDTHISTRIAGTVGYMAPEYAMRGYLTDKADVYSFGIVALEIVSGKSNTNYRPREEFVYLLDWAYVLQEQGSLLELVDPVLGKNYPKKEVMRMLNVALLCTNPSPTLRPPMSAALKMLEGKIPVQAPIIKRGGTEAEEMRRKAFERISHDSQTQMSMSSNESQVQRTMSIDAPWVDSEVSLPSQEDNVDSSSTTKLLPDLYDVKIN